MSPTRPALTAADLLSGPRGRRLCLELAGLIAAQDAVEPWEGGFAHARFYVAYELDPGRGQSVILARGDAAQPKFTSAEVAALLDAVSLSTPPENVLLQALVETASTARYWQEPDGEDKLAATPEMRRALIRFAQAIVESPHASRWTDPIVVDGQWIVTLTEEPPRPRPESGPAAEALEQARLNLILEEFTAARDRPADPTGNWSGTWWSRPEGVTGSTSAMPEQGPLGLWLVEDGIGERAATIEKLDAPTRPHVYEIDSPDAWAQLCREQPITVTCSKRHDWYRTTGRSGAWVMPDWSRLQETYDGVHLSLGGYLRTAGQAIPVSEGFATVLAGWDPDTTYWLRVVAPIPGTRQAWERDREDLWSAVASTESTAESGHEA
ncbi:hypothetical protein [Arthrobacter alpinus]|uniref:hypothetical protein n=1 Tax=Arthrobacter alpinus TaxID=656366 RepID=UPI000AA1D803|nr:hypothetical protein [Arthrobacter alpinus]